MGINRFLNKSSALVLAVSCLIATSAGAIAKAKAGDKWVDQGEVNLAPHVQLDGDSFGMEMKTAKGNKVERTYRLYGTDCTESDAKDKLLKARIQEQVEYFGCKPEEIPAMGKAAAAFTRKRLIEGKPRVWTRGKLGERLPKNAGRPQRYYALIEVTAPDGQRRWLHELLLEAGLARAFGKPAAWPPEEEDSRGERAACEKFAEDLKRLEKAARRSGLGLWKNPAMVPDKSR